MPVIARTYVGLTGWNGAPGVNVVHWEPHGTLGADAEDYTPTLVVAAILAMRTAYEAAVDYFSPGVTVHFPNDATLIDVATGDAVDSVVGNDYVQDLVAAGTNGQESRATQACLALKTARFINGRRLQGRLFLGPISSGALQSNGQMDTTFVSDVNTAFLPLTTGGTADIQLAVWHRPKPPNGAGDVAGAVTALVGAKPAILRTRRD